MFDIHEHITQRVHETKTVHEHRAPTDESVRLLKEMEQAARDKVVKSIRLENSPIDCVIYGQEDALNMRHQYCVYLELRGRRLEVRRDFNQWEGVEKVAAGLMTAVSERIAAELLAPAFAKLPVHLRVWP